MGQKWTPPKDKVSPKEVVGRRTFGANEKIFVSTNPLMYQIEVFLDSDLTSDLSVDRLGVHEPNEVAVQELTLLGHAHSNKLVPKRDFRGWAQIRVVDLNGLAIKPTDAVGEINRFHAEISRDEHRSKQSARSMAFRLCCCAMKNVHLPPSEDAVA